jgi:CheY-like chemotaxis protein
LRGEFPLFWIVPEVSDAAQHPPNGHTLLIVDDEQGVRMSLDYFLSGYGFRVVTAESGRKAVAVMETEVIDGAMVDLHMPGMNGPDTCLALHAAAARLGRPLRVWFMSGAFGRDFERRCGELGAICVFRKPFEWPATLESLFAGFAAPAPVPTPLPGPSCVASGDTEGNTP